jgi:hypothetical protein
MKPIDFNKFKLMFNKIKVIDIWIKKKISPILRSGIYGVLVIISVFITLDSLKYCQHNNKPENPTLVSTLYDSGEKIIEKNKAFYLFENQWIVVLTDPHPIEGYVFINLFLGNNEPIKINDFYKQESTRSFSYRQKEYFIDLLEIDESSAKIRIREKPES